MRVKYLILLILVLVTGILVSQNPATIVFPTPTPNPPSLGIDTYTRAVNQINLKPGFKYGFVSGTATNLLNLSLGTYPGNVNSNYADTTGPNRIISFNPNSSVGITSGNGGVNSIGAFTYQFPIYCPPGTQGMKPNLAIAYNSNGSVGNIGKGFALNGISVISRTIRTSLNDPNSKAIDLDNGDAFSLNGERLLLKSGVYGQNSATYNFEIENYDKIVSIGNSGSGPNSFVIYSTDGKMLEFGTTPDSKLIGAIGGKILSWFIKKVTDPFGNYMEFFYTNQNGEINIEKIEYTRNLNATSIPFNKVQFEYEERSDPHTSYFPGDEFRTTKILKAINSYDTDGKLVKKYTLEYEYNNVTLLSKIAEVDANGNDLNPTIIDWTKLNLYTTNNNNGFTMDNDVSLAGTTYNTFTTGISPMITLPSGNSNNLTTLAADINGDGRKDIVTITNDQGIVPGPPAIPPTYNTLVNVFLSKSSPNSGQPNDFLRAYSPPLVLGGTKDIISTSAFDEDDDNFEEVFISSKIGSDYYMIEKLKFDGTNYNLSVLEGPSYIPSEVGFGSGWFGSSYFNTFHYGAFSPSAYFVGKSDITGDNLPDQIVVNADFIKITPSVGPSWTSTSNHPVKVKLGDFNGDGVNELFLLSTNVPLCFPGATINSYNVSVLQWNKISGSMITIASSNVACNISSVVGPCGDPLYKKHLEEISGNIDFADFNNDGKTDILYNEYPSGYFNGSNPGSANFRVSYSDGSVFKADILIANLPTIINGDDALFFAGDMNNDGSLDWNASAYDKVNFISSFRCYASNGKTISTNPISYSKVTKFASAMGDFDGNGTIDYLSSNTLSAPPTVEYNVFNRNTKQFVNRIYNIKDDYKIEYSPLVNKKAGSDYPLYNKTASSNPSIFKIVRLPLYVVNKTVFNDMEKNYAYENSLLHRQGKGFAGFEKMYTLDVLSNILEVTTNTYDVTKDFIAKTVTLHGLAVNTPGAFVALDNSNISSKTTTDFTYGLGGPNYYVLFRNTTVKDYLKSTITHNDIIYDPAKDGKPVGISHYSTPWSSSNKILENTQTIYYVSKINPISSQPYHLPLKTNELKLSNDVNGQLTSNFQTDFSYDAQCHLTSKVENSNITTVAVTTSYGNYDDFNNPGLITVTASDLSQPRTSQLQYDNTGRFVTKTTNSIGNFESCDYEVKYGNKVKCTDISGLETKYEYDGLGRLIKTTMPDNTTSTMKYEWFQYNPSSNVTATRYGMKTTAKTDGNPTVVKKFDIHGSLLETRKDVFGGGTQVISMTYNALNQLTNQVELPSINTASGIKMQVFTYDQFLRPSTITQFITNNVVKNVTYQYNTISTDANYVKGFVQVKAPNSNANQFNFLKKENNEAGQNDKTLNFSSFNTGSPHTSIMYYNQYNLPYKIENSFNSTGAITTLMSYDALGRQQQLNDPSSGLSTYQYNSIGELVQQTTPNGTYTFAYDVLGRMISKTSGSGTYQYQYVTVPEGRQMLEKITGPNEITEYKYDNLSRTTEKKQTLTVAGNRVIKSNYSYDAFGRISSYTYPNGFILDYEYDGIGNMVKIKNGNTAIWQLSNMYTPELVSACSYGNGLTTTYSYDPYQNLAQKNCGNLRELNFNTAPQNNSLIDRSLYNYINSSSDNEHFSYDDFDRLTNIGYYDASNTLHPRANQTYKENGNIDFKSDAGNYIYGQANKPYQLTGINNSVGNISLNTLNVTYNDFKKVSKIAEMVSNKQFDFVYGNSEQRIKMDYNINSNLQYQRYYGDNYDRQEIAGTYKEWDYIYAPTGLAAVYYNNNGNGQLLYAFTDNMGSPILLTNTSGAVVEEYSFDAWGRRRNPANWSDYTNGTQPQYLIRGFTMHEHLDDVGIINMNGRIYDPVLGRFLQADPDVQAPDNLQNYNRYAYGLNNPLKYTDPTGNDFDPYYSVPTYQYPGVNYNNYNYSNYNYSYTYGSGYGGTNFGYGGGYTNNYSGTYSYDGYSSSYNAYNSYNYSYSTTYGSDYVTTNSSFSYGYGFSVSYGNNSFSANYGYSSDITYNYPNYSNQYSALATQEYLSSGLTVNQIVQLTNVGLGSIGLILNTAQVSVYNDISQAARKTGNIADALLNKYSIDMTIGRVSQGLGYVGVAVNGLNLAYKFGTGQEIQTRDIVDFGIGVAFSVIAVSNPIGIIGLGIYGLLDAYGAFDGIKSTYLNQTIVPGQPIKP